MRGAVHRLRPEAGGVVNTRTVTSLADIRAADAARLRKVAGLRPDLAGLFNQLADTVEGCAAVDVVEGLRWSPVLREALKLAASVTGGAS